MNRVPPAYADAFRKHLSSICDAATFDDDERFYRMEEWQRHVELKWLNACKTYDSDRAQGIALASLGDPIKAGKRLRKPWWYRLAFYHRLHAFRLCLMVAVTDIVVCSIWDLSLAINHNSQEIGLRSGFDIRLVVLGSFCAGLAGCSNMSFFKDDPKFRSFLAVFGLGLGAKILYLYIYHLLVLARLQIYVIQFDWDLFLKSVFTFIFGFVGMCMLIISLIAELFDLPSRKPSREQGREVKPDVFSKVAMPFVWLARRLLRAGR